MSSKQPAISVGEGLAIVANLGVVIGLIFVWMELRQSQTQLAADVELNLAAAYQTAMGRAVESEEVAVILAKAYSAPETLTRTEYLRLMSIHAEWMSIVYATYQLWQSGAIDEATWDYHSTYYLLFLQTEWMQNFWRGLHHEGMYPALFLEELEARMPGIAASMQPVPGGTFRMGSDADELPAIVAAAGLSSDRMLMPEVPSREVTVGDFQIDTHDVTNGDFALFVLANPGWGRDELDASTHNGRYLEHWTDTGPPEALLDHPATFINWQSAVAYCEWKGKRLPTEAEYEWAAQDGETGAMYPWGDEPPSDELVNWGGNDIETTVPVGSYPPNARGLYDMAGNVWHFTADPWLGSYAEMAALTPGDVAAAVEQADIRRVVRGGSYGANAANLRVKYRDSHRPFDAREMVGFRCARSVDAG